MKKEKNYTVILQEQHKGYKEVKSLAFLKSFIFVFQPSSKLLCERFCAARYPLKRQENL